MVSERYVRMAPGVVLYPETSFAALHKTFTPALPWHMVHLLCQHPLDYAAAALLLLLSLYGSNLGLTAICVVLCHLSHADRTIIPNDRFNAPVLGTGGDDQTCCTGY